MVTDQQRRARQSLGWYFIHHSMSLTGHQHQTSYNLRKRPWPIIGHSALNTSQTRWEFIQRFISHTGWVAHFGLREKRSIVDVTECAQGLTWESSQGHLDYRTTKRGRWDSGLSPTLPTWCVTGQHKMSGHRHGSFPNWSKRKRKSMRCYASPCPISRLWGKFPSSFKYKEWCRSDDNVLTLKTTVRSLYRRWSGLTAECMKNESINEFLSMIINDMPVNNAQPSDELTWHLTLNVIMLVL